MAASALPPAGSAPGPPPASHAARPPPLRLTWANLVSVASRVLGLFENRTAHVQYREHGIWPSESLAVISAAVATGVDVLIESGTGPGQNAEVLARFFEGTPVSIYTIEGGQASRRFRDHAGMVSGAVLRLGRYPNVEPIWGDGFEVVPALLRRHRGRRIGVVVDGPKFCGALELCVRSFNGSGPREDVKFCAIHDVGPAWGERGIWECAEQWARAKLLTYHAGWRGHFGFLNGRLPPEAVARYSLGRGSEFGPGLGIFAGWDTGVVAEASDPSGVGLRRHDAAALRGCCRGSRYKRPPPLAP